MHRRMRLCALTLCLLLAPLGTQAGEVEPLLWPTPASHIVVQGYKPTSHEAIDIAGTLGDDILACEAGTVVHVFTGCENVDGLATGIPCLRYGCSKESRNNHPYEGYCNYGFGNGVVLRHDDGSYTAYGHFSAVSSLLKKGERVERGQYLGAMGSSGRSSGVHLHLAITLPRNSSFTKNRRPPSEVFAPFVVVETGEATRIASASARLEGRFSYLGDPPKQVGICLGTSEADLQPSPEYLDTEYPNLPYLRMLYDVERAGDQLLKPGTTYYWRCYADTESGTVWGEVRSFVTLEAPAR